MILFAFNSNSNLVQLLQFKALNESIVFLEIDSSFYHTHVKRIACTSIHINSLKIPLKQSF